MNKSIKRGLGFGLTSGIITTLGLMVGLYSGTNSRGAVLAGIVSIAIADAFSDALGMHLSEEAGNIKSSKRKIWRQTFSTLCFKFLFAIIFIFPVLFLELKTAIIVSVFIGMFLISIFSYIIAQQRGESEFKAIAEHVLIGILVIVITYFVGKLFS